MALMALRRISRNGFTLIELLIAMSIMLALVGLVSYSFLLYSKAATKHDFIWQQNFNLLRSTEALSVVAGNIVPYMVNKDDKKGVGFYFLGDGSGFTAVSETSLHKPGTPAVFRLFAERAVDGQYQLVFEEALLNDYPLTRAGQVLPFEFRSVLYRGLSQLDFQYRVVDLNASGFDENDDFKKVYKWVQSFDGLQEIQHPVAVKVNLAGFVWQFDVAERAALLKGRYNLYEESN